MGAEEHGAKLRERFEIAGPPRWVTGVRNAPPPCTVESADPVEVLLVDRQLLPKTCSHYLRQIRKLNSAQGVEALSQVRLDFDPAIERLTVHSIRIWRDGTPHERASRDAFKLIQRETNLERQLYDGRMSAVALLDDVRIGDVIDIATTHTIDHPELSAHFHYSAPLEYPTPVKRCQVSVIAKEGSALAWKTTPEEIPPVDKALKGGWILRRWVADDVPTAEIEANTPGWHAPIKSLYLSDSNSWSDIAAWVSELWGSPTAPPSLVEIADEIAADIPEEEQAERAERALAFVRDEIRYLGLEDGIRSLQPCDPEEVLRRRFGDCKDKSRLLCMLLRRLKIPASPVLVNSTLGRAISDMLPSPAAFDHVIVCAKIAGKTLWIDPTRRSLAPSILELPPPAYGLGLLVSAKAKGLVKIPNTPVDAALLVVKEKFAIRHPDKPAQLEVETVASGFESEHLREVFGTLGMDKYRELREAQMRDYYPKSHAVGEWSLDDSKGSDSVTIHEQFEIEGFAFKGDDGERAVAINPSAIRARFPGVPDKNRRAPWALPYPCRIRQEVTLDLPFAAPPIHEKRHVECEAFGFNSELRAEGKKQLHALFRYWSKRDHVRSDEFAEFGQRVSQMADATSKLMTFPLSKDAWKQQADESAEIQRLRKRLREPGSKRLMRGLGFATLFAFLFIAWFIVRPLLTSNPNPPPRITTPRTATKPATPGSDILDDLGLGTPSLAPAGSGAEGLDPLSPFGSDTEPPELGDFGGSLLEPDGETEDTPGIQRVGNREVPNFDLTP